MLTMTGNWHLASTFSCHHAIILDDKGIVVADNVNGEHGRLIAQAPAMWRLLKRIASVDDVTSDEILDVLTKIEGTGK